MRIIRIIRAGVRALCAVVGTFAWLLGGALLFVGTDRDAILTAAALLIGLAAFTVGVLLRARHVEAS